MLCIVAYYFGPKLGVGSYMDNLIPILMKKENRKILLVTNNNFLENSSFEYSSYSNVEIYNKEWLNKGTILSVLYMFFIFPIFLRQKKVKLVLFPTNPIIGVLINCKILSVIHDINEYEISNKYGFYTFFRKILYVKRTLTKSTKIIVISNFVKKQIITKIAPPIKILDKISVIYNGIRVKAEPNLIVEDNKYFVYVGRIDPEGKNLYFLLSFFEKLKTTKTFKDHKLYLIGGINQTTQNESEAFLKISSKNNSIEYLGYVNDEELATYYSKASACILMSKYEGFGFPLLEAYANNCKVIRHGENEVFYEISGNYDFIVFDHDLNDIDATVDKLIQYLKKEINFESHLKLFDWENVGHKYLESIHNLENINKN